nr:ankyrin repeat and SOCS box protein 15-like isoform X1 [Paramormyrops kingsleyae]
MDSIDEMDEDQLIEYAIQLSVQETCKQPASVQTPRLQTTTSDTYFKIITAIEKGDEFTLQELSKFTAAFSEVDGSGCLPLHKAAIQPNLRVLWTVLNASYKLTLEEMTVEGETALTLAVQAGLLENMTVLLEHGASPHNTNSMNESPLLLAVRIGSHEMVSTLLRNNALVDQICLKKWTAMHEAAKVGCSDIMMLLIKNGANIMQTNGHGVSPLGVAAEYGHAEVLEILIHKGADVNARAYNGETVLYDAAGSGNPDCIRLLVQYGADPDAASVSGHLPIHRAAYQGHYLALQILIQITSRFAIMDCGQSPVHSAADGGHVQCLQLLIENGFNVNTLLEKHVSENYGDMRRSPLYFAVSNGDVTCIEMLLNAGAESDHDPLRCLLVAVRAGRYEIVKLLLANQADVNCYFTVVSNTVFPTALQYCLRDEMMMRLLLNNGYDAYRCFCCNHDNSWDMYIPWSYVSSYQIYRSNDKMPFCDFISSASLKDVAGKVVRILVDYVSHVTICSKLKLFLEKQREWPEICDILGNPRSLKHLCRLQIREQMTMTRLCDPSIMNAAPFPPRLKHYLLYNEYDLYSRISSSNT